MTIADEKIKPITSRKTFVRLNPARVLNDGLVSQGSGIYQWSNFPLDAPITSVKRNGVALSKVTTVVSNDQWSYDESAKTLRVKLASAPSTSNVLIGYYYLFYTSGDGQSFYENPDDSNSTLRVWEPRLLDDPVSNQSFESILSGVLTIADTAISLNNSDGNFEQYLSTTDSFYNKDAKVWLFLNDEKQRVFTGKISSVTIDDAAFSVTVYDVFTRLNNAARLPSDVEFITASGTPKDLFKPIPIVFSEKSFSITAAARADMYASPSGGTLIGSLAEGLHAACNSYTAQLSTSVNRGWTLCRSMGTLKNQSFGSVTRITNDFFTIYVKFSSYSNVRLGDTIKWTEGGTPGYGLIIGVGTFTKSGSTYDIAFFTTSAISGSSIFTASKTIGLRILGSQGAGANASNIFPLYGRDFSVTETTQPSGAVLLKITFANNFEAFLSSTFNFEAVLDPTVHDVIFSMENNGTYTHGTVLKKILEMAGLTCNAASFTAANTALSESTCFSIPNVDETEYSPWLKYVQDLLQSTLGYVALNSSDEITYKILDLPASSAETRGDANIINSDAVVTIDYQDIITDLATMNPHIPVFQAVTQTTLSNNVARYLHDLTQSITVRHVMAAVNATRAQNMLNIRSARKVTYTYDTATEDIDSELGDDITLTSRRVLGASAGNDATVNLKVLSVAKSGSGVSVVATDLNNLNG